MSLVGGVLRLQTTIHTPSKRRLAGKTQTNNTGTPRRVAVFHQDTLAYLGSTVSKSDGTWELKGFPELPPEKIFWVMLDDSRSFDPIAFGNVTLVE